MGSGRYSDALTYEEWYNLALAQRVHYNFVEIVAIAEVLLVRFFHSLFHTGHSLTCAACFVMYAASVWIVSPIVCFNSWSRVHRKSSSLHHWIPVQRS